MTFEPIKPIYVEDPSLLYSPSSITTLLYLCSTDEAIRILRTRRTLGITIYVLYVTFHGPHPLKHTIQVSNADSRIATRPTFHNQESICFYAVDLCTIAKAGAGYCLEGNRCTDSELTRMWAVQATRRRESPGLCGLVRWKPNALTQRHVVTEETRKNWPV
ncbi:hypothetical protein BDY19DRAFT_901427 [Irpex rosettiformis]|uniref:Uncharacterized protein n=1 Tax=Irpex rosettiformis TaxID=378272 RepID=A0ACB8UI92_9APHY|nr:hypothetical protein BDY19DRAFT_901427 [Irpex rosettiformis]